jgi:Na+-transporting methylmalonyl-CoA/oxaloacetate decarboxylase gamma subunit
MAANFLLTLQITLAGMTLVFLALILLWWMMELLVRLVEPRHPQLRLPGSMPGDQVQVALERKKRAALTAVALALSQEEPAPDAVHEFPLPPTAIVSAWQAVNRANMLKQRGRMR